MPGYKKKTKKKTKKKSKKITKDKYALKMISDLSRAKKRITDKRIQLLEERIAKLNQELSEQKHLENVKNHKLTFDSIRHGLDQLKPKQKDQITQELISLLINESDISTLFSATTKKGTFSNNKQYIVQKVGSGEYGSVYKVKYRQHITSIKVIPQRKGQKMDKLMKEIYILSSLNKVRNFLRYYSYFVKDDKLFIVTECFEGDEYYKVHNTLTNSERITMFKNLFDSIHEMHQADIVHNDLHMGNVLYESPTKFRIIDFGNSICYGDFKHSYCLKRRKLKKYTHKQGFSGGYHQVAPWRSKQCGKKGCSIIELMAGDMWALCHNFHSLGGTAYRKYLVDKYFTNGSSLGWEKCASVFIDELPSIYKEYTGGKTLPAKIQRFYLQ